MPKRQVTIDIPEPTTWRQNHEKYKGAKGSIGHKAVTFKLSTEEHSMLMDISDRLHVDCTNMLRQLVVSLHAELAKDDPGPD